MHDNPATLKKKSYCKETKNGGEEEKDESGHEKNEKEKENRKGPILVVLTDYIFKIYLKSFWKPSFHLSFILLKRNFPLH